MKKRIVLQDREIDYTFRRYRRQKYMRLTVHSDASLTVTAPKWVRVAEVEDFIRKQGEWILSQLDKFSNAGGKLFLNSRASYEQHKELARRIVHERLALYNRLYGFKWNRVSIRNQRTCWGSCSEQGNLNYNYKVALLPPELADYVVVHELCHLGEMNHSKKFWALVERAIPDHKARRAALRKNGLYLNRV